MLYQVNKYMVEGNISILINNRTSTFQQIIENFKCRICKSKFTHETKNMYLWYRPWSLVCMLWYLQCTWGAVWHVYIDGSVQDCSIPSVLAMKIPPSCTKSSICWITKKNMVLDTTLEWRYNGRDGVSNHQPHDCLLNRLFRCRSKKISKVRVTGLC